MDIFYRLFYTVFSMSYMVIVLTPVVLLLRVAFRKLPRNFTMALWMIFYLRAVCPIGLTSPICLFGRWNRRFHLLIKSIGLQTMSGQGLMTSWIQTYQGDVEATVPYMVCTIFWIAGVAGIILFVLWKRKELKGELKDARLLFDRVYQSEKLQVPVRRGIFRTKIYLPGKLSARETKNILLHQQLHCVRKDDWVELVFFLISCIHWWNPCIWLAWYLSGIDREMACDEAVVRRIGWTQKGLYAQDIMNMKKDTDSPSFSFPFLQEKHLSRRAEHMLYMEPAAVWKKALSSFFMTVCFFFWFALSAIHTAWNGGVWEQLDAPAEESLFASSQRRGVTNEVIAHVETKTPGGVPVRLELMITQGTWQNGGGYEGQFVLRMLDEQNESVASLPLSKIFTGKGIQQFDDSVSLAVDDYNEDGTMELSLGQEMEVEESKLLAPATGASVVTGGGVRKSRTLYETEKKTVYGYYLINIEENRLSVISDTIYQSDATTLQTGSMVFSYIQGTGGIITTKLGEEKAYYIWESEDKMYRRQSITQQEIDDRIAAHSGSAVAGEKKKYTLTDTESQVVIAVETETDNTGSQSIQRIRINPKGDLDGLRTKEYTDVHGYFCDLAWTTDTASDNEEDADRYAVLTFNGTSGRTFIIYDVKQKKEFYRQEDGNKILGKVFQKYNGKEITFEEGGMVVYSLMEMMDEDILKISFAANADGGVTVKGSYVCRVSTGKVSDLQYTQELK